VDRTESFTVNLAGAVYGKRRPKKIAIEGKKHAIDERETA
jgi:hypothetical protein